MLVEVDAADPSVVTVTFAPVGVGAQATQLTFSHDADAALPSARLSGTGI